MQFLLNLKIIFMYLCNGASNWVLRSFVTKHIIFLKILANFLGAQLVQRLLNYKKFKIDWSCLHDKLELAYFPNSKQVKKSLEKSVFKGIFFMPTHWHIILYLKFQKFIRGWCLFSSIVGWFAEEMPFRATRDPFDYIFTGVSEIRRRACWHFPY